MDEMLIRAIAMERDLHLRERHLQRIGRPTHPHRRILGIRRLHGRQR